MEYSEKREKISAITKEVAELHPLLENILPKLPNVKSHEHTHGQYERGADFILEVENLTTKRRSHIGVVVKCGKIGAAKISDVEEQIKECAEERMYKIMNRVRCSEVWVFASGGYSERAKEKLNARLSGRSIQFFGPEDIVTFVDDHFKFFWDNIPPEIGSYFQSLRSRLEIIDKATTLVSLSEQDTYIDLDIYERINKQYKQGGSTKASIKNINFFKEACSIELGLLEAEMGFGKSRLCRRLVHQMCSPENYHKNKIIPIFATYRQYIDNHNGSLSKLIKNTLGNLADQIGKDGVTTLIILDGIDECSSPKKTSTELFEALRTELKHSESLRVMVTSRPLKSLVDRAALYTETRTFGIRPLSLAKIIGYLEITCQKSNLPSRLFEDLKRSQLFKQLPQSPIAAALFSNLMTQKQQDVPMNLTELYSKSIELMLGRWDQKKSMATEKNFKTAQLISEHLACYYIQNRLVYVAKNEFVEFTENYLNKRNTGVDLSTVLHILLDRSNIFILGEGSETIGFRHRSFSEYLCAHKKSRDRSLSVTDTALNPYWINVFYFYVGTLQDCPEILTQLQNIKANNETEEWMQLISVPSYLLAAFQTEFHQVEENLKVVLIEASKLFLRVKAGDTKTKLSELSEMHLLYLFKSIVVESLGYEFLEKSFEGIALKISEVEEDQNIIAHALFFLACVALHFNKDFVFKFMIETIGAQKLPLSISLAIRCELESSTKIHNTKMLKSHIVKLRRLLSPSKTGGKIAYGSTRTQINDLFDKPLSTRIKASNNHVRIGLGS